MNKTLGEKHHCVYSFFELIFFVFYFFTVEFISPT